MKAEMNVKARLSFVSLGCSKNLVDSERMLGSAGARTDTRWCPIRSRPTW